MADVILTDKHFVDWEGDVFGYGYGSGEPHTLGALMKFFASLDKGRSYDSDTMEAKLGPEVFWLLINALLHADMIDYGTSPRCGWLTVKGEILRDYLAQHTVDGLCDLLCDHRGMDYVECFRDLCQCEVPCENPLFR
jgi:hypothetical protein